ncbi:hypothetical protein BB465_06915 [Helicobacter pylori]|nr:hypothetical protein BB465_06915 [Helicobacter pylori]
MDWLEKEFFNPFLVFTTNFFKVFFSVGIRFFQSKVLITSFLACYLLKKVKSVFYHQNTKSLTQVGR